MKLEYGCHRTPIYSQLSLQRSIKAADCTIEIPLLLFLRRVGHADIPKRNCNCIGATCFALVFHFPLSYLVKFQQHSERDKYQAMSGTKLYRILPQIDGFFKYTNQAMICFPIKTPDEPSLENAPIPRAHNSFCATQNVTKKSANTQKCYVK